MELDKAISLVKQELPRERFEHTIRVANVAEQLAEYYKIDPYKIKLAAIFHDYAKNRCKEELHKWIIKSRLPKDLLNYHHELWHGPVGALLVELECGIQDREIQQAIRYHTTGRSHMSIFEMIIYVADYIEPGREIPNIEMVRKMAFKDLITATWMISRNSIQYLMSKNVTIYPDTFYAYNYLTNKISK